MVETKIRQGVQARLRALDSAAATLLPSRQQTGPKREDLELQLKAIETKIGAINRMINAAKMTRTAPCVWWWGGAAAGMLAAMVAYAPAGHARDRGGGARG